MAVASGQWRCGRDCDPSFSGLEVSLSGLLAKEFEGLCVLTAEAAHPDRRKHFALCRILSRVIGERNIGQWPEGHIDEREVGLPEGQGVENTNEFWQGVAPRVLHRQ